MNEWMFRFAPLFSVFALLLWVVIPGFALWVAWRWMRAHERVAAHLSEIAAALRGHSRP